MSYRRGFILAFSGVLALGAASVQAQDVYRKTDDRYNDRSDRSDDRMYKEGVYADDDFWYGDEQRVTNTRFRGMDQNRDGIISRQEWRGNRRAFRNQDWNNDGVLSGREVRASAQRVRNTNNTRVEAVDRDRNGRIDRSEWTGSRNDFRRLDRDNDGYITSAEARLRYR
jgi:EF hand domain-containing protein